MQRTELSEVGRPARRLLASGSEMRARLCNAIERDREHRRRRRRKSRQSRERSRACALREGTGRIRVSMSTRVVVSSQTVVGVISGRVIVFRVPMQRRPRVCVTQNDSELAVHRREHEARGNERTQQQHR